jgi:phosphate transport system permease protein
MIIGTLIISTIALLIGVPLSVLTALFLTFYAPERIKRALTTLVDLMASFPSILFGLWGFIVLMPMAEYWAKLIHKYLGWSLLSSSAGIYALAIYCGNCFSNHDYSNRYLGIA